MENLKFKNRQRVKFTVSLRGLNGEGEICGISVDSFAKIWQIRYDPAKTTGIDRNIYPFDVISLPEEVIAEMVCDKISDVKTPVRIDVEEIWRMQNERQTINELEIDEIEFYEKGIKLNFNKEKLEEWRFTGLITIDFITTGFYHDALEKNND